MKKQLIFFLSILIIGFILQLNLPKYIINKKVEKSKKELQSKIDDYFNNKDILIYSSHSYPEGEIYEKKELIEYSDKDSIFFQSIIDNNKYKKIFVPKNEVYSIETLSRRDSFFNYTIYSSSITAISAHEYVNKVIGSYNINGSQNIPIYQKLRYYNLSDVKSYYHTSYEFLLNDIKENASNYHIVPDQLSLNKNNLKQKLEKFENDFYNIKFGFQSDDSSKWVIGKFTSLKISSPPYSLSISNDDFHSFYTKSEEPLKLNFKAEYYNVSLKRLEEKYKLYFLVLASISTSLWLFFLSRKTIIRAFLIS